jgi:hypothetical protein
MLVSRLVDTEIIALLNIIHLRIWKTVCKVKAIPAYYQKNPYKNEESRHYDPA